MDILGGIGAGLGGVASGLAYNDEQNLKREALAQKEEIARLQNDIKVMLAGMNIDDRQTRHATPSGNVVAQQEGATERNTATNMTRENIATILEGGRNDRWATPSGNVTAANASREKVADANNASRMTIQQFLESGRNRRFDVGDETRRHGIDTGAATATRGQDTTAATAAAGRASAAEIAAANRASAERREQIRSRGRNFGAINFTEGAEAPAPETPAEVVTGTKKELTPVEVVNPSTDPGPARSPEATQDQTAVVSSKLTAAIKALREAKDDAGRAAAAVDVKRLREELAKALSKGGA